LAGLLLGACGVCVFGPCASAQETEFVRGDVNQDGRFSVADALFIQRYLFVWDITPACKKAADGNDSGSVDIGDYITLFGALNGLWESRWDDVLPEPYPLPGLDPTPDSLTCDRFEPVETSEESADVIRIGDAVAYPGATIEIPFYVSNSTPIEGFQIVVETDLALFQPSFGLDHDGSILDIAGTPLWEIGRDDAVHNQYRGPFAAAVGPVDDGRHFVISVMFDYLPENCTLPASTGERLLFKLIGKVPETVPGDTVIQLYPSNGDEGDGVGSFRLKNELCYRGEASYASLLPVRLKSGKIEVRSGLEAFDYFMRGDANRDADVNIADPIFVISYLFARGAEPACADAADMNDDGALDIADAVAGLSYLFGVGGSSGGDYAAGMGLCGKDGAADALPLCIYDRCPAN